MELCLKLLQEGQDDTVEIAKVEANRKLEAFR